MSCVASVMVRRAVETLEEGVTALSLMHDALGSYGGYAADAGFSAGGTEGHAVSSIKVLLRLFERNPENIGAAWRAEMGTALVWLGQHGSYEARRLATAALTSCVVAASNVPLDELAASGALEMAVVNASMGSAGVEQLPSAPSAKARALEEHQKLRVLSMQGLVQVAARGAHRQLIDAGAAALVCRTMADSCAVSWGEGGECTEPLVGAAVQLAEHLASSPETHEELLREEAVRWLFHTAHRDMALHNPASATAALAHLLEPFRRASACGDWRCAPLVANEEVDVDYRGFGAWYPASLQRIVFEDGRVHEDDHQDQPTDDFTRYDEHTPAHSSAVCSVDLVYHCDGSRDRGVLTSRIFRHALFRSLPCRMAPEPEPEPKLEPAPAPTTPGVGRLLALAKEQARSLSLSQSERGLQSRWLSSTRTAAIEATQATCRPWLPSLPVRGLRTLGAQLCDAARTCDVSSSGTTEDALKLGGILRSVTAVSVYAHPSVIHASGWLQAPVARADHIGNDGPNTLPLVIAALVQIAEPPTPRPTSASGLDWFSYAGPREADTLTDLSTLALLHLSIGIQHLEGQLSTTLRSRARAPLDGARRRLAYAAGATHARLGGRGMLYFLPPDLAQLIGKLIERLCQHRKLKPQF